MRRRRARPAVGVPVAAARVGDVRARCTTPFLSYCHRRAGAPRPPTRAAPRRAVADRRRPRTGLHVRRRAVRPRVRRRGPAAHRRAAGRRRSRRARRPVVRRHRVLRAGRHPAGRRDRPAAAYAGAADRTDRSTAPSPRPRSALPAGATTARRGGTVLALAAPISGGAARPARRRRHRGRSRRAGDAGPVDAGHPDRRRGAPPGVTRAVSACPSAPPVTSPVDQRLAPLRRRSRTSRCSTADASATSVRSPVFRSLTSITPDASRRPTTTARGMPISSASVNFTPAETCVRSSTSTRSPAAASCAAEVERRVELRPLAGGDQVYVARRDRRRPDQTPLVVVLLGDRRHHPGHPDAVAAHGGPDRLAVRAEHVDGEGVGEPAAELEDVPDLDAPPHGQRPGAAGRARVAGAHLGRLDRAVRGEVPPADHVDRVPARLVRPRSARRCRAPPGGRPGSGRRASRRTCGPM